MEVMLIPFIICTYVAGLLANYLGARLYAKDHPYSRVGVWGFWLLSWLGYLAAWMVDPDTMAEYHGFQRDKTKPSFTHKFFRSGV
jgi:hypothetical protein